MDELGSRLAAVLPDRYTVERELGRGGMATIFLAQDLELHRLVAIKVLRPEIANAIGVERFLLEIDIAAPLTHPHILPLFESGRGDGLVYYVMPYVEGESLRDRLTREKQLPLEDAVRIAKQVASALAHAHSHGIVHRDIKPGNIMLVGGEAVVADFGIARAITSAGGEHLTETGIALGTPAYMSPEQAGGEESIDGRSDIYALGCVLYEMLGGEPPFTGPSSQAVIARQLGEEPRSLRVVRPKIPPAIEAVVRTALEKVPADRFPTATKFLEALDFPQVAIHSRGTGLRWQRWAIVAVALGAAVMVIPRFWPGKTGPLSERDWVLVADFSGPAEEPDLAVALRELVTAELNQSKYLSTMPHQVVRQALRDASMPETTTVTPERARELAFRSSVRAVVSGSITPTTAGRYATVLDVTDAASGGNIFSASGPISLDSFADGVQRLAREMREGLGERRQAVEADRPLYRVTTPSFPAYLKYVTGLELALTGNISGSNRVLFDALAQDSGFAAAWAAIGMNFVSSRNIDSARIAYAEALRRPDRLTDAQRYRLEGDAAYALRRDLEGAVRAYTLYLQEVPSSIGGRSNLALYLSSMGRYEEALRDVDSAIALNPFGTGGAQIELLNRTALLISLGRLDDARASLRRLTGPYARYAEFQLAAAAADWKAADSLSRQPTDRSDPGFLRFMRITSGPAARAALGDPAMADRELAAAAAGSSGSGARWYQRARLLLAMAGRQPVSWTIRPDSTPAQAMLSGLAAVLSGDTARARRLHRQLVPVAANDRGDLGAGPELLRALLDMRAGHPDSAVGLLAAIAAQGEHDALNLDRVDSFWLRLAVADAFRQMGQRDSARAYLDLLLRPEGIPPSHYALRGLIYVGAHERLKALTPPAGGK